MTPIVLWVALACGVEAGYEPTPDGHLEYIIQIEPQLLGSLAAGQNITSEVPGGLDVRHYRLTVGTAELPHIAAPTAGGRLSAAGGASQRPADGFEAPGRTDEAVGTANPQVRVGYELISATGGQYVIEIDPRSLRDLNHADLTGDIPPGLPVTRFVISTNPGSAAVEKASRVVQTPFTPAAAAPAAVVGAGANVGDDDPSSWQPEVPPTSAASPLTTSEPPALSLGSALPDDPPGGAVTPPPAMPPPNEPTAAPPVTPLSPRQEYVNPPGGGFQHKGFGAGGAQDSGARENDGLVPVAEKTVPNASAPGRFPANDEPFVAMNGGADEPPEGRTSGERKHRSAAKAETNPDADRGPAEGKIEKKETAAPKPWLPLTVTLLTLFASLGGNVFLGWIAWDSYHRNRAGFDKFDESKASLST